MAKTIGPVVSGDKLEPGKIWIGVGDGLYQELDREDLRRRREEQKIRRKLAELVLEANARARRAEVEKRLGERRTKRTRAGRAKGAATARAGRVAREEQVDQELLREIGRLSNRGITSASRIAALLDGKTFRLPDGRTVTPRVGRKRVARLLGRSRR